MRFLVFFFMSFFAWASPAAMAASPAAAEPVEISIGEATIHAVLYRPEGSGPFPAVVAMHGCSGLYGKSGAVARRYGNWATRSAPFGAARRSASAEPIPMISRPSRASSI